MIEIYSGLFIGNESDCVTLLRSQGDWRYVHACKEPYHRQLLGYRGRGAPKNHPEYFFAKRDKRLYLNLVDAPNPDYIPKQIVDAALEFIRETLLKEERVLVHCNQGESRSPTIGLLYLASCTDVLPKTSLEDAEVSFRKLYPSYNPGRGMRGFTARYWNDYVSNG